MHHIPCSIHCLLSDSMALDRVSPFPIGTDATIHHLLTRSRARLCSSPCTRLHCDSQTRPRCRLHKTPSAPPTLSPASVAILQRVLRLLHQLPVCALPPPLLISSWGS